MQRTVGRVIFIFGIPGSGKSTQAKRLSQAGFGRHIETSRVIQDALGSGRSQDVLDDGTVIDIAQQQQVFDSGNLNQLEWVEWLMRQALYDAASTGDSVVMSGSPRSSQEMKWLMPFLAELFSLRSSAAVYLMLSESAAQERLANKQEKRKLDANYEIRFRRFRDKTLPVIEDIALSPWSIPLWIVNGEWSEDAIHEYLKNVLGGC